jgi:hypothetical protein
MLLLMCFGHHGLIFLYWLIFFFLAQVNNSPDYFYYVKMNMDALRNKYIDRPTPTNKYLNTYAPVYWKTLKLELKVMQFAVE